MHPLEAETIALLSEAGMDFNPYIIPASYLPPYELGPAYYPPVETEVEDEVEE